MKKEPSIIPFGFMPESDEFRALVRDCTLPDIREKFRQLAGMNPRSLRSEIGSALRLVQGVFRNPEFLVRCGGGSDIIRFLQHKGTLIVERGDADEDVTRIIIGGINLLITDHCEGRIKPYPPIGIWLDECTNARTAGPFEEKKAGETRKVSLHWRFICQHPNFPGGAEGFFANCQEKHIYRTGDYTLARKLAPLIAAGIGRREDESRADLIERITRRIMHFPTGWRFVVGPTGVREEYVPMLESPWPDWPGLREAKLQEKLAWIYQRPEYQTKEEDGGGAMPGSSSSSPDEPPPQPKSPSGSSPAQRWQRAKRKPADGSASSESDGESVS